MSRQTVFAKVFFVAALALLLTSTLAPPGVFATAVDKRPPAPEGCGGTTEPLCATIVQFGVTYYYYFPP